MRVVRRTLSWTALGVLWFAALAPMSGSAQVLGEAGIDVYGLLVDVDTRPDLPGVHTRMSAVRDVPAGVQTLVGSASGIPATRLSAGAQVVADLSGLLDALEEFIDELLELQPRLVKAMTMSPRPLGPRRRAVSKTNTVPAPTVVRRASNTRSVSPRRRPAHPAHRSLRRSSALTIKLRR